MAGRSGKPAAPPGPLAPPADPAPAEPVQPAGPQTPEFAEVEAELVSRGFTRMVFDLSRIQSLLELLGGPQRAYPSIHLTGTNGKTSTTRMIECLLRAYGLRTGRYTSPHLHSVRERICIDGEPVDEERFVEIYREVAPAARIIDQRDGKQTLTYFDLTTAMALAAFADAPVDVAAVEVGLGGERDSTNVLHAGTVVITPIGVDHTEWLGDTIASIATAKAGIIHSGATVITAKQPEEALPPIRRRCEQMGATLACEGIDFSVVQRDLAVGGQVLSLQGLRGRYDDLFLPLHGAHQAQNAALALAAVEAFLGADSRQPLDPDVLRDGFATVTSPGRLERVGSAPTIMLDAAHNPHGMAATVQALREEFDFARLIAVLGVLGDKDLRGMLELLKPVADLVICTRNSSSRSTPAEQVAEAAAVVFGSERVVTRPQIADAIQAAIAFAEAGDEGELGRAGILVTGSVFTVADARALLTTTAPR